MRHARVLRISTLLCLLQIVGFLSAYAELGKVVVQVAVPLDGDTGWAEQPAIGDPAL